MSQPVKGQNKMIKNGKPRSSVKKNLGKTRQRNHPKYGTSKLEDKFAKEFLDKLGVPYVRQFEAKDIGRFYDFAIPDGRILLEIDGNWWHRKRTVI